MTKEDENNKTNNDKISVLNNDKSEILNLDDTLEKLEENNVSDNTNTSLNSLNVENVDIVNIENIENEEDIYTYEIGYILVPTFSEEDALNNINTIKDSITSFDAKIISEGNPKIITLAYPISKLIKNINNKFEKAYFGWIKFTASKEKISFIKKKLDLNDSIIRFLLIKIDMKKSHKAPIVAIEVPYVGPTYKKIVREAVPVQINKEEIDKQIDELVKEDV